MRDREKIRAINVQSLELIIRFSGFGPGPAARADTKTVLESISLTFNR